MNCLMSDFDQAKLKRLRDDFEYFARYMLRIRTKSGEVVPFILNRAQKYLHDQLEQQRRKTGKVRAVICKGRQMGCSTYVQGRFYWRLWGKRGLSAFILTHEQAATDNLFALTRRYHELIPDWARHPTAAANAKELVFAGRECSYSVATAGTKDVGRSRTIQLLHGSEVASQVVGVNVARYKVSIFVLSAFSASIMGSISAHYIGFISPNFADFFHSIELVTMVVIGGMASVYGSIVGAVLLTALPQALATFEGWETVAFGAILMLCMIFLPRGLVPTLVARFSKGDDK